jgi:hypothetical protein
VSFILLHFFEEPKHADNYYRLEEILHAAGASRLLNYRGINYAMSHLCNVKVEGNQAYYQLSNAKKALWLRKKLNELANEVTAVVPTLTTANSQNSNPYQNVAIAIVVLKSLVSQQNYDLLICLSKCTR